MSRMNYGPRFKPTIADTRYYSREESRAERDDRIKMALILKNQPLHKKELRSYKAGKTNSKKHHAKTDGARIAREAAEAQMADAVRQAVTMLEFNMTMLMQHPPPQCNYARAVNQAAIVNTIVELRSKCGVRFDDGGDFHRVDLVDPIEDRRPATAQHERANDDFRRLTLQVQRAERLKREAEREAKIKRLQTMHNAATRKARSPC